MTYDELGAAQRILQAMQARDAVPAEVLVTIVTIDEHRTHPYTPASFDIRLQIVADECDVAACDTEAFSRTSKDLWSRLPPANVSAEDHAIQGLDET